MKNAKKIVFFVGETVISYLIMEKIARYCYQKNIQPTIFLTSRKLTALNEVTAVKKYDFFEKTLFKNTTCQFLDTHSSVVLGPHALQNLLGAHIEQIDTLKDQSFADKLSDDQDILGAVSIRNYQIVHSYFINRFRNDRFLWNLHMGLLPAYRGVFAPMYAMNNQERSYGWSLHHIDAGIDTGPVIQSIQTDILPGDTMFDLYARLIDPGAEMVIQAIDKTLAGTIIPTQAQDARNGKYYTFPAPQQILNWEQAGIKLVNPIKALRFYGERFYAPDSHVQTQFMDTMIEQFRLYFPDDQPALLKSAEAA